MAPRAPAASTVSASPSSGRHAARNACASRPLFSARSTQSDAAHT